MRKFREFINDAKTLVGLTPPPIQSIIDDETRIFRSSVEVSNCSSIPDTRLIPIQEETLWLRIPDVIACFVDMQGSTRLSATSHPYTTAKCYRYFTQTTVRIFHEMESPYIDVRGDGVFALYDSNRPHTALAAVASFKTFVANEFTPRVKDATYGETFDGHYGIDCRTVLVRKIGLKIVDGRADRQNEVWAGKPVNMAAKLASKSRNNEVWVSDRYLSKANWRTRDQNVWMPKRSSYAALAP